MKVVSRLLTAVLAVAVISAKPIQHQDQWLKLEKGDSTEEPLLISNAEGFISDCGNSSDIGRLDYLHISPDPPQGGADLTFYGDMLLKESVTSGRLTLSGWELVAPIPMPPIPLMPKNFNLCGPETRHTCPLDCGTHFIRFSYPIPLPYAGIAVTTSINLQAVARSDKDRIFCISMSFRV